MQYYVPYFFPKKRKKINLFVCVMVGVLTLVLILTAFMVIFAKNSKKLFPQKTYYYVYSDSAGNNRHLEENVEMLKILGGAGNIIEFKGKYYLIIGVYSSREDASSVLEKVSSNYSSAGIVEVTTKKFDRKTSAKLAASASARHFNENFWDLPEKIIELSFKFFAGEITQSSLIREFLGFKTSLESSFSQKFEDDKYFEMIYAQKSLMLNVLSYFFDNFFITSKKYSLVAEISSLLAESYFELCDNL